MSIRLTPIATVHTTRTEIADDNWGDVISEIVLDPRFPDEAFEGLDQFSHIEVIFFFDKVAESDINSSARHPRNNTNWPKTGIFAQRGKNRPNRLGSCIAKLLSRNGRKLKVQGLDAIDGTPVLDIKPVIKEFLPREEVRQPQWATELMKDYWKKDA